MSKIRLNFAIFSLLGCLLLPSVTAHAQTTEKTLAVGNSEIYEFDAMTTTAVGNPAVIDIVPLSARRLLVNARGIGQTTLFVYDRRGRHTFHIAVVAPSAPYLSPVAAQIQSDIGLPDVTARAVKDTILLEGSVTTPIAFQRAGTIAGVYAAKIKNLLLVTPEKNADAAPSLAQTYAALLTDNLATTGITVRVLDDTTIALVGKYMPPVGAEFVDNAAVPKAKSRPRSRKAGGETDESDDSSDMSVDLDSQADNSPGDTVHQVRDPLERLLHSLPPELRVVNLLNITARPTRQVLVRARIIDINKAAAKDLGVNWGTLDPISARGGNAYLFQPQPILFGQLPGVFYKNPLAGGLLRRVSPFAAQLNLLISENKARVLSEPSLMVLDGNEGSILVGGEIPIPVAQSSGGTNGISASVTVEFKPFGVRLRVRPTLISDTTVQLTVTPEVSELDYGNAVEISGFSIPALTVRRATSTLQMEDGETLIIGGLYSSSQTKQTQRIPLLSEVPVIGQLFRNTTSRKEESELLILIQPEIVKPDTPGTHPSSDEMLSPALGGKLLP